MKKLVVFTGSGISVDSGLQTFRGGKDAAWQNHSIDKVCNILTWKSNLLGVHEFYNRRRGECAAAQPNDMHRAIANWQTRYDTTIITQNVDDLHERGGASDVIHVHGRLSDMQCLACGNAWDIGYAPWNPETDRCPKCNSRKGVKPGVVFFNEHAPRYSDMYKVIGSLRGGDMLVVLGTSGQVVNIGAEAARTPARTLLSNLNSSDGMDNYFDIVEHGQAHEMAGKIDEIVAGNFS